MRLLVLQAALNNYFVKDDVAKSDNNDVQKQSLKLLVMNENCPLRMAKWSCDLFGLTLC